MNVSSRITANMSQFASRLFQNHRLRSILVASSILQILGTAGLVGFISYRSGQASVSTLANALIEQVSDRVLTHLANYSQIPRQATQANYNALKHRALNIDQLETWDRHLIGQSQIMNLLGYIYYGNEKGEYIEVQRFLTNVIKYGITSDNDGRRVDVHALDPKTGKKQQLLMSRNFDPRDRIWYRSAVTNKQPHWTPVYLYLDEPQTLGMSFVQAYSDEAGTFRGVLGADYALLQTSNFLRQINILSTGKAFIIERDGNLIATSAKEAPFTQRYQRIRATEYNDPLIQLAARSLQTRFSQTQADGSTKYTLQQAQQFELSQNSDQYRIRVSPFQDQYGLDWLVIVVVPESAFMKQIHLNQRNTLLLTGLATLGAVLFSILLGRWITQPLQQLSQAAQALPQGDWNQPIANQRGDEIGQFITVFEQVRRDLKDSSQRVAEYSEGLTHKNDELAHKNEELASLESKLRHKLNLFLHAVSHDLRNPVIGMGMTLDTLCEQPGEEIPISRKLLTLLAEGNDRQLQLINTLMETHSVELWGIRLQQQPTQLVEIIQRAIADLRPLFDKEQTQVTLELPADLPLVAADPLHLTRVYQNLFSNALKHNPSKLHLTVTAVLMPEGDRLYCTIADNGIGIAPDQCQTLFDPYTRGSQPNTPGLGLGLYLCQQIILAHRGEIGVKSRLQAGTTFWFTLPVSRAPL